MILSLVTNQPVYMWNVPDRCLSGISQLSQSFVAHVPTFMKHAAGIKFSRYLQKSIKLMRQKHQRDCLCTVCSMGKRSHPVLFVFMVRQWYKRIFIQRTEVGIKAWTLLYPTLNKLKNYEALFGGFLTHCPLLFCLHAPFSCCLKPSTSLQPCPLWQGHTSPSSLQGADKFHHSIEPWSFMRPWRTITDTFCHKFLWKKSVMDKQMRSALPVVTHSFRLRPVEEALTCFSEGAAFRASLPPIILPYLQTHTHTHLSDI